MKAATLIREVLARIDASLAKSRAKKIQRAALIGINEMTISQKNKRVTESTFRSTFSPAAALFAILCELRTAR